MSFLSTYFDGFVKSLQGRHSGVRGNDDNECFLTFYEFIYFDTHVKRPFYMDSGIKERLNIDVCF